MPHAMSTESVMIPKSCSEDVNRRKIDNTLTREKNQRRNNEDQKEKQLSTKHCTEN